MGQAKRQSKRGTAPGRPSTISECAAALDLSPDLLRDYVGRGCPHTKGAPGQSNMFDPAEVATWMHANGLSGKPGRPIKGESKELLVERIGKEREMRENWRLRNEQLHNRLVDMAVLRPWLAQILTTFRNKMIGVPAAATPLMEGRDAAERHAILADKINEALTELADSLDDCGQLDAAA